MIITTILLTILSAFLYRLGGMSKRDAKKYAPWKWMPSWAVNTKARDVGCAFLIYLWMSLFFPAVAWWVHLIAFLGAFGGLCTYWDDLFGYDNFFMHGFIIAFALLPYVLVEGHLEGYLIRIAAVSLFMGIWCMIFENDYVEECGRGAILIAALPLMII